MVAAGTTPTRYGSDAIRTGIFVRNTSNATIYGLATTSTATLTSADLSTTKYMLAIPPGEIREVRATDTSSLTHAVWFVSDSASTATICVQEYTEEGI